MTRVLEGEFLTEVKTRIAVRIHADGQYRVLGSPQMNNRHTTLLIASGVIDRFADPGRRVMDPVVRIRPLNPA